MIDFDEILSYGLLGEWYAIPLLIILIILKVIIEKKYKDSLDERRKD